MPVSRQLFAASALICGAIAKVGILFDGNAAVVLVASMIVLITGMDVYRVARDQQPTGKLSYFTIAVSVAAIEVLVYDFSAAVQLLTLPLGAAYLWYTIGKPRFVVAWAFVRIIVVTVTAPEDNQLLWRVAQLMLLLGLAAAYFIPYHRNARATAVTCCVVAAILLVNGKDMLPHNLPVWLLVVPISYLAGAVLTEQKMLVETVVVFAILCVCFMYPFSSEQTSSIASARPCADFANTVLCTNVASIEFQVRVSDSCCCADGFILIDGMCVKEECKSNLLSNSNRDCCKIMRNVLSDTFLHGPYQCLW